MRYYGARECLDFAAELFSSVPEAGLLSAEAEQGLNLKAHTIEALKPFQAGPYSVMAFPANHAPGVGRRGLFDPDPDQPASGHVNVHHVIEHAARFRTEQILAPGGRIFAAHIAHEGNPPCAELVGVRGKARVRHRLRRLGSLNRRFTHWHKRAPGLVLHNQIKRFLGTYDVEMVSLPLVPASMPVASVSVRCRQCGYGRFAKTAAPVDGY